MLKDSDVREHTIQVRMFYPLQYCVSWVIDLIIRHYGQALDI